MNLFELAWNNWRWRRRESAPDSRSAVEGLDALEDPGDVWFIRQRWAESREDILRNRLTANRAVGDKVTRHSGEG